MIGKRKKRSFNDRFQKRLTTLLLSKECDTDASRIINQAQRI